MIRPAVFRAATLMALAAWSIAAAACTGGDGGATPASATRTSTPAGGISATTTKPPSGEELSARTYTLEDAQALLNVALITPPDLDITGDWQISTDNTLDNAAAAAQSAEDAAVNERCGRLLGRTVVTSPADVVSAFLAGQTLGFFSTATVYATEAGAVDCAAYAAERLQRPGEFAKQFGSLFVDPATVVVQVIDWPPVGDASFAATLTGKISAAGTQVDLTLLVIGFRKGNVLGAIGSARSGQVPPREELQPLVTLLLDRIATQQ